MSARRDYRGACGYKVTIIDFKNKLTPRLSERGHCYRHCDFHAELSRLRQSPTCQSPSRDTRWKAEIVLDLRTCSRLPPRSGGIENNRLKALRCPINSGSETGGACPNDREIEAPATQRLRAHSDCVSKGPVGRVAHDISLGSDDCGQIVWRYMEPLH
ncbi:hypothetical protein D3C72_1792170 [compost metagenome]